MVDLSALGAQALAQVEKARRAAAESLASALNQKPKLDLTLELDAPKIAIPVPATEDGRGASAHMPPRPCLSAIVAVAAFLQAFVQLHLCKLFCNCNVRTNFASAVL